MIKLHARSNPSKTTVGGERVGLLLLLLPALHALLEMPVKREGEETETERGEEREGGNETQVDGFTEA